MIVDSHCHLDDISFDKDREEVIKRACDAGVSKILTIGTGNGPPQLDVAIQLAELFPEIHATVGVHPHHSQKAQAETFDTIQQLSSHHSVIALGEIGLDYYYDDIPRNLQREVLLRQMDIARCIKKPIILHVREAWDDILSLLQENWQPTGLGGVMHCFTGTMDQAYRCLDAGLLIAFGGILTFNRSEDLRLTAAELPLNCLLVETDAPYLTPHPLRKIRRNEPCYAVETARKLAEIRNVSLGQMAEATTNNFCNLFKLNNS